MPSPLRLLLSFVLLQPVPSWGVADQFGRVHRAEDYLGRPVLLVGGDRAAREALEPWIDAVLAARRRRGDTTSVPVVRVADLRSIPRLMRRMAGARAPRDTTRRLLLDFEGRVAVPYRFEPGTATVLVLDRAGAVRMRVTGMRPEPDAADRIAAALGAP